ncbi:DUF4123 domain-containing protein [Luteimonas abyssi]|uniref:DUF4123 domain-containing protein n=1 Tax=Luteimonas abyssi TaxID=1247514 RepID=UPI000737D200|nr:DUF4123 domain-containing protein [Luteimonas abyssi]
MRAPSLVPATTAAPCEEIERDELDQRLRERLEQSALLLDSRIMEDWAYPGLAPDALEFPPAPEVEDLVSALDADAPMAWAWANTDMRGQQDAGPLLAGVRNDALLEAFSGPWASADGSLLIVSDAPLQAVADHIGTLRLVGMPDGGEALFRWNPAKLRGIMEALSPARRAVLLGPAQAMIWRENTGPRHRWWMARNPHKPEARFAGASRFVFSAEELQRIQQAGHRHFVTGLAFERLAFRNDDDERDTIAYIERTVAKLSGVNISSEAVIRAMAGLFPWRSQPFDDDALLGAVADTRRSPEDRLDALRAMEENERTQQ